MPNRSIRSGLASCLFALLLAQGTGMPTHRHHTADDHAGIPHLRAGDVHAHGVRLLEQEERTRTDAPQLAALPAIVAEAPIVSVRRTCARIDDVPLAMERAPPVHGPRAPPLPA